ncbi:CAP domain-containing protein [Solibacillus sp. FSL W7-1436]|uniref:CAP domain-containing protein n=1 Tax=Solibacillus sp. FSL W7-1436 TaxID=2921705 RepID=UPI0030F75CE4
MNKKWLATSLCAATLFATSFTAADAASLDKEEKKGANPQQIQMIKGENYEGLALKLIEQLSSSNGEFKILSKDLINQTLKNMDANTDNKEKVVPAEKASTNKEAQKETTTKPVKKEDKAPQAPAKEKVASAPEKEKAAAETNNKSKTQAAPVTKAPSNSNNQQTEAPAKTTTNNASQSVSEFEKQVVDLTNAERTKAGLKPLEMHNPLMAVAHAKSADMAKNKYFSHTSPTFGSPFDQIKSAGISYRSAGENIAQGQRTPQQVVQGWMDSPGHRQNIMNANFTHIGVGFVEEGYYWTQQFIQL